MDVGSFTSGLLTGLREGVEAALIVSIILAYLARTGNRRHFAKIWAGTFAAVAVSFLAGLALFVTIGGLEEPYEQIFEGLTMLLAAGVVTWMLFWMRRQAAGGPERAAGGRGPGAVRGHRDGPRDPGVHRRDPRGPRDRPVPGRPGRLRRRGGPVGAAGRGRGPRDRRRCSASGSTAARAASTCARSSAGRASPSSSSPPGCCPRPSTSSWRSAGSRSAPRPCSTPRRPCRTRRSMVPRAGSRCSPGSSCGRCSGTRRSRRSSPSSSGRPTSSRALVLFLRPFKVAAPATKPSPGTSSAS